MNTQSTILAAVRAMQSHGIVVRAIGRSATARRGGGGDLAVSVAGASRTYAVEMRDRVTPAVAAALDTAGDQPVLVVAPYIGDGAADVLRARGLDYVDTAGNAHLVGDGTLIDVRGRRRVAAPRRRSLAASRAFTRSGAQTVFVLLSWPELAARPLREIARVSGVSLGTAQIVIDELTSAGYLRGGPDGRTLARGGELLGRWAESYALWLAPTVLLATFAVDDPRWWEGAEAELADAGVQLGGEPAASLLGVRLRPTTTTLYADAIPAGLIARHRMRRDEEHGTVAVRRRFWNLSDGVARLVPAPLVFGDLVASGDPRQREHADRLRAHDDRLRGLDQS